MAPHLRVFCFAAFALAALPLTACGGGCKSAEGPDLESACHVREGKTYEKLPIMCGIHGDVGSDSTVWRGAEGTCTCDVMAQFPTGFLHVSDCKFEPN